MTPAINYISREAQPRRNVYWSRPSVCLCVCLSFATFPYYCTDPDVTWGNGKGSTLVVHRWADLQSVHGFRCYNNIALNGKCQRVFVIALCLVTLCVSRRPREMYCDHAPLCVCLCVSVCVCPQPHAYTITRTRM